jgi:predicted metal-binding membrane protein
MIVREHLFILTALISLSGFAWAATVYQAGAMGWGLTTCSMTMGTPFSPGNGVLYVMLWGVMMVAMMLPAMAPIVGLFQTIARRKQEQGLPFTPAWVFVHCYGRMGQRSAGRRWSLRVSTNSLRSNISVCPSAARRWVFS